MPEDPFLLELTASPGQTPHSEHWESHIEIRMY